MITKDQLELLRQAAEQNKDLRYTIGGAVETAVHSSLERERVKQLNHGAKTMKEVREQFQTDMALEARHGLARVQFQTMNVPEQDRELAEQTWRHNHIKAHEEGFERASTKLKNDAKDSFKQAMQSAPSKDLDR